MATADFLVAIALVSANAVAKSAILRLIDMVIAFLFYIYVLDL